MPAVMLRATEETFWWSEKKSKLLLEAAERGSRDGGSGMGRQELVGEWPRHTPLTPSPGLCSAKFSLNHRAERRGTCSSFCIQTVLNNGETDPRQFIVIFSGHINFSRTQAGLAPKSQRKVSAVLGWKGKPGSSPSLGLCLGQGQKQRCGPCGWLSLPSCPCMLSLLWRPGGDGTWSMRGEEISQACLAGQRALLMPPQGPGMLWGEQVEEKCHGGLQAFPSPHC